MVVDVLHTCKSNVLMKVELSLPLDQVQSFYTSITGIVNDFTGLLRDRVSLAMGPPHL